MSSNSGFFQPLLRSKSFSYGALRDFSMDNASGRISESSYHPPQYNRSLTTCSDDNSEDEATIPLTESAPLLIAPKVVKSFGSTSNADTRNGQSEWITRITPPFLSPTPTEGNNGQIVAVTDNGNIGQLSSSNPNLKKGRFSGRDKCIIGMIAAAEFFSTVVFSCIAPFFPQEAAKKGASQTVTGLVFGIFELVMVLVSPIFGRYLTLIGSNFMYGTGLCVTGVTAILFGLLNLVPAGTIFITFAFLVRIFEAVGDAAIITAAFAIGLLETFSGLGFAAGPPIGGALYEVGGYQLPFMVLGTLLLIAGLSTFWILPKQNDTPTKAHGSIFHLLSMHTVWTMVFAIIVAAISIAFLDPTLQPHLSDFNLSPVLVGLMFLIIGGTYAVTAPFWGYLIDRKDCARWVMLFGTASCFVSLLFIGPSPLFPFDKKLWIIAVSEIFMGLGLGALFIPPFQQCLMAARQAGYPDTFETYGLVSGIFQSSMSFGAFLGPTLGGFAAEIFGFPWAATALAMLHIICATAIVVLMISEKRKHKAILHNGSKRASEQSGSPLLLYIS